LLEATPEFLKITQINENGKELNKAQLPPRKSRTVVAFDLVKQKTQPKLIASVKPISRGINNPWDPFIAVLLAVVGTLAVTGFLCALQSSKACRKTNNRKIWTRVPEESSQESEFEN